MKKNALAKYIDHTLLKPDATEAQIEKLCAEAKAHDFATVCVNPHYIPLAKKCLEGTDVGVAWQDGRPFKAGHYIRLNLALPLSRVQEAFDRLKKYVY